MRLLPCGADAWHDRSVPRRYFSGQPLWPFGHGRSYTSFRYDDARVVQARSPGTSPVLALTVTNTGRHAGDVELAFVTHEAAGESAPRKALAAFRRVRSTPVLRRG